MTHQGGASKIPGSHFGHILQHFDHWHEVGHLIGMKILTIELCCAFGDDYANLPIQQLMRQIRWYLAKQKIVTRRVTQIAQNTRSQQVVMDECE